MSMTREEAIKWLEEIIQDTDTYWGSCSEALQKELDVQKEVFLLALSALRPVSREQVEKMWRGEWEWFDETVGTPIDGYEREWGWRCSKCKTVLPDEFDNPDDSPAMRFCQWCGAPMTDKAVGMVMERLEALHSETKTD